MRRTSDKKHDLLDVPELFLSGENVINDLSQVITKGSVAAAGINVDTPIVSAIIGNLTGTLPTKKNFAKEVKCKICNCSVSSYIIFQKHISGAKHQRKLKDLEVFNKLNDEKNGRIEKSQENQSSRFMCSICPLEVNSAIQLQNHLSGERHKKKLEQLKSLQLDKGQENKFEQPGKHIEPAHTSEQKVKKNQPTTFACPICNIFLNSKVQQNEHFNSRKHKLKKGLRYKLSHLVDEENPEGSCIQPNVSYVSYKSKNRIS